MPLMHQIGALGNDSAPENKEIGARVKIYADSYTGRGHEYLGDESADYFEDEVLFDRCTAALATGQVDGEEARFAAQETVWAVLKFLRTADIETDGGEEWRTLFAKEVRETLHKSVHEYDTLSAQVCAVCVERKTGRYIVLSIGGGAVYGHTPDGETRTLLSVQSLSEEEKSCCANFYDATVCLQVRCGAMTEEKIAGFTLAPSGVADAPLQAVLMKAVALEETGTIVRTLGTIRDQQTQDDVSAATLIFPNAKGEVSDPYQQIDPLYDTDYARIIHTFPYFSVLGALGHFHKDTKSMTYEELIENHICEEGHVLRTMMALIASGLVDYQNGQFVRTGREESVCPTNQPS